MKEDIYSYLYSVKKMEHLKSSDLGSEELSQELDRNNGELTGSQQFFRDRSSALKERSVAKRDAAGNLLPQKRHLEIESEFKKLVLDPQKKTDLTLGLMLELSLQKSNLLPVLRFVLAELGLTKYRKDSKNLEMGSVIKDLKTLYLRGYFEVGAGIRLPDDTKKLLKQFIDVLTPQEFVVLQDAIISSHEFADQLAAFVKELEFKPNRILIDEGSGEIDFYGPKHGKEQTKLVVKPLKVLGNVFERAPVRFVKWLVNACRFKWAQHDKGWYNSIYVESTGKIISQHKSLSLPPQKPKLEMISFQSNAQPIEPDLSSLFSTAFEQITVESNALSDKQHQEELVTNDTKHQLEQFRHQFEAGLYVLAPEFTLNLSKAKQYLGTLETCTIEAGASRIPVLPELQDSLKKTLLVAQSGILNKGLKLAQGDFEIVNRIVKGNALSQDERNVGLAVARGLSVVGQIIRLQPSVPLGQITINSKLGTTPFTAESKISDPVFRSEQFVNATLKSGNKVAMVSDTNGLNLG